MIDKTRKVKAELTYGQVVLIPHLENFRTSRTCPDVIYRFLDVSFSRIIKPKFALPEKLGNPQEVYVAQIDGDDKQLVFTTKKEFNVWLTEHTTAAKKAWEAQQREAQNAMADSSKPVGDTP